MSIGGGKSKGGGVQMSESENWDYGSDVWGGQSPYLQDLYRRSKKAMGAGDAGAAKLFGGAQQALGGALNTYGQSNAALQRFTQPGEDPALAAYAQNLGQQFNEQFLPGLKGDAALAGGLGGSRQQIGAALGAQRAMQTLGDFTAQTYAGQQERALQAAQAMQGNAAGMESIANTGAGFADFARSMPWYKLNQYAGLLGSPVMKDLGAYGKSKSTGNSKNSSWKASFGFGSG